jgi:hypothetical protein
MMERKFHIGKNFIITGVTARCDRSKSPIRLSAYRTIKQTTSGDMLDAARQDGRFYNGILYSPERIGFMPGEIRARPYPMP